MSARHAVSIFKAALRAADPAAAVHRALRMDGSTLVTGRERYRLDTGGRIFVVGAGKASAAMGQAVEDLLKKRIAAGLINVKYGHGAHLQRIVINECGHPVPDENGIRGAREIAAIASAAGERDLLICLISGGASALMPLPADGVTLEDKQGITQLLLQCGADIHEINCVRKHLSLIKGGGLAKLAYPARVLTLILSDVIGDDLDTIGSGPTVADPSTFDQALRILAKYHLEKKAPRAVLQHLRDGGRETPKPGDPAFRKVRNLVIGSNRQAVDAAAEQARALGYRSLILSTVIEGETRDVAGMHVAIAKEALATGHPVKPPCCIISGGETTVTIKGHGKGGRNQEFALAAAIGIAGLANVTILSGGTDGTDGPTDAAGAIADGRTVSRGEAAGRNAADALRDNDGYHFFEASGGLLKTGPTRTNVMDVRLMLIGKP